MTCERPPSPLPDRVQANQTLDVGAILGPRRIGDDLAMTIDLARIKEAAEKATKGPWKAFKTTSGLLIGIGEETGEGITDARGGLWGDAQEAVRNADHIASCDPQTILQLVAVVEAALTIDAAFKRAGTQGVTMDWGPVLEAIKPFTNGAENE